MRGRRTVAMQIRRAMVVLIRRTLAIAITPLVVAPWLNGHVLASRIRAIVTIAFSEVRVVQEAGGTKASADHRIVNVVIKAVGIEIVRPGVVASWVAKHTDAGWPSDGGIGSAIAIGNVRWRRLVSLA